MPTVQRDGLDIYYEIFGEGPRLLVFNGSGTSIESTRWLLNDLAKRFTLLVHDQRGLGRTGLGNLEGDSTMADFAHDGKAVLDAVGWATANVFGMSFGGMVAQEFAVNYPECVERLALLCTSAGGGGGSSYPLHTLEDLPEEQRRPIRLRNLDTRFSDEWLAEHPNDQALVDVMDASASAVKSDEVIRGERHQLRARAGHNTWDRLHRITSPTLIAAGRFDGLAPLANSEVLASAITNSTLEIFEGGHLFVLQDRRAVPKVTSFLTGD